MSIGKIILNNKKVNYEYNILYKIEAGIALLGPEVKSLRLGKASFTDSFVYPKSNEIYLHNLYISPYEHMNNYKLDPTRVRKLLLNRSEINKIMGHAKNTGVTIVPTKLYFNERNMVKIRDSGSDW